MGRAGACCHTEIVPSTEKLRSKTVNLPFGGAFRRILKKQRNLPRSPVLLQKFDEQQVCCSGKQREKRGQLGHDQNLYLSRAGTLSPARSRCNLSYSSRFFYACSCARFLNCSAGFPDIESDSSPPPGSCLFEGPTSLSAAGAAELCSTHFELANQDFSLRL
jgi:hypothetical protein